MKHFDKVPFLLIPLDPISPSSDSHSSLGFKFQCNPPPPIIMLKSSRFDTELGRSLFPHNPTLPCLNRLLDPFTGTLRGTMAYIPLSISLLGEDRLATGCTNKLSYLFYPLPSSEDWYINLLPHPGHTLRRAGSGPPTQFSNKWMGNIPPPAHPD